MDHNLESSMPTIEIPSTYPYTTILYPQKDHELV